jgi:hypothetical protein
VGHLLRVLQFLRQFQIDHLLLLRRRPYLPAGPRNADSGTTIPPGCPG